jgi:hypothetical protein
MSEGKQKTGGISQRRACPLETPAGQGLKVNGVTGNVCFHRGKKEEGQKGGTMRIACKKPAILQ